MARSPVSLTRRQDLAHHGFDSFGMLRKPGQVSRLVGIVLQVVKFVEVKTV